MSLLAAALWAAPAPAEQGYHKEFPHLDRAARWFNNHIPWHAPYAHHTWRQPTAMIVPPVANFQSTYSWGVARTRMAPIYHQFTRPYVPPGGGGEASYAPIWPSSTLQQGVYYVRGPW
jgi:hypothetical protein